MDFIKRNKYLITVLILAFAYIVFQVIVFKNTTWENYPYTHQDFWRRLEDTQFYLGQREFGQFHPPLVSLLYGALLTLGIDQLFIINFFAHSAFAILIFLICKRFTKNNKASLITSIVYITNFSIIQQSNYLGLYDLLASFVITLAAFIFITRKKNSKLNIILIALILGLAGLIQYSGLFALPFIAFLILFDKEISLRERIINISVLTTVSGIVFGSFLLYRYIKFGDPLYSNVEHLGYLKAGISNIWFYIFSSLAFFKLPAVVVATLGIKKTIRDKSQLKFIFILLPSILFFVFLYIWGDWRFMTYFIPIVYLFFCNGLILVYNFLKTYRLLLIPAYLAFAIFVIYNSLYLNGNFGVATSLNNITELEVTYNNGFPTYLIHQTYSNNFIPYFLLDNNWDSRASYDKEVNYFLKLTSYKDVLNIQKVIQKDPYSLVLNDERFVRYHQFNVAFRKNTIMDPSESELEHTKYLVSDHYLTNSYPQFRLINQYNNLFLYIRR